MASVRVNRRQIQSNWGLFKQVWYQTVANKFSLSLYKCIKIKLLSPKVGRTFFLWGVHIDYNIIVEYMSWPLTLCLQDANSITSFEIMSESPPTRAANNPWPTWPRILRVDYGHEEVKVKHGKDPRIFDILSEVRNKIYVDTAKQCNCVYLRNTFCW